MRFILFSLFFLLPIFVSAQKHLIPLPEIPTYEYDSNYIESFNSKLALRFVMPRRVEQFSIRDATTGDKYVYNSNEHIGIGVGFTYKWLAVDMTINPSFTQKDTDIFGTTKEFNLKGSAYLKKTLIDAYLRSYEGFFVANPVDVTPGWQPSMPHPQRSDIKTVGWGFNYTIPFNWDRYTPKVTFVLDGKLKKSAGSFMTISSLYFYHMRADSSIVDDSFRSEAQIHKLNIALLGQLFGYSYTFIYKDFYATGGVFPGITFPLGTVFSQSGGANPTFTANFKLMIRAGIGYNIKKWYAGAYMIFDNNQVKLPGNLILGNTLGEFRLFVGYRITAPKLVDDVINKL
jgi:uncharacterized protein DUF4421